MTTRWPGLGDCPPGTYPVGPRLSPEGYARPGDAGGGGLTPSSSFSEGVPAARLGALPAPIRQGIQRVLQAGGAISSRVTHPSLLFFEQLWRRLPEQGIFSANLNFSNPLSIPMGTFRVPPRQTLLLFDLRPDVFTFSGADPFDWVPVANRRFSGQMGWDITIDGQRLGNTKFELNPIARVAEQPQPSQLSGRAGTPAEFAAARAAQFGASLGTGTALQPQRPERFGPRELPLTLWVNEGSTFAVSASIFRRILFPIAFFEFDLAGLLVPAELAATLFQQTSLRETP